MATPHRLRHHAVLIVVEDLETAKAFFVELGMELEGQTPWSALRLSS